MEIFKNKKVIILGLFFLILVMEFVSYNLIPKHNVFVRVGNMHVARSTPLAVLLKDGNVLVLGGESKNTSELYVTKKRKFKRLGNILTWQTATLLNDGQVLITGVSKKAQLYNPVTRKYKTINGLKFPRIDSKAVLLKDGRVLIMGGYFDSKRNGIFKTNIVTYSEIYNPKTETFSIGPKLNIPRFDHNAILLNDGNVLVVGGVTHGKNLANAEIYDINKNKFINIDKMRQVRVKPQLIKIIDGRIFIIGGFDNEWIDILEEYNPKTGEFSDYIKNDLTDPTAKAVLLKNNNILFLAGDKKQQWYYVSLKNSAILDPKTKDFIEGPSLREDRGGALSATVLNDGKVLVIGGKKSKLAEVYIP